MGADVSGQHICHILDCFTLEDGSDMLTVIVYPILGCATSRKSGDLKSCFKVPNFVVYNFVCVHFIFREGTAMRKASLSSS